MLDDFLGLVECGDGNFSFTRQNKMGFPGDAPSPAAKILILDYLIARFAYSCDVHLRSFNLIMSSSSKIDTDIYLIIIYLS